MSEKQASEAAEKRSLLSRVFSGGFKKWLLLGPFALIVLWAVFFFAQPLVATLWQFMPIWLFAAAMGVGLTFNRLSTRGKVVTGVAAGALGAGLIYAYGLMFAPFVGVCLGGAALLSLAPRLPQLVNLGGKVALGGIGLWLVLANTVPFIQQWQLAMHVVANTQELKDFPVTLDDRVLPRATALEYALKSNDDRTKQVERVHIVWLPAGTSTTLDSADEKTLKPSEQPRCVWQAPLGYNPDVTANKFWYSFWGSSYGVIRVDGSEMNRKVDSKSGENAFFMFGAESWVTDTIFRLRHPLSKPAEKLYWQKPDGNWSLLVSYTSYKPTWTGTMIPVMSGVMEFGHYGGFSNWSPKEAKEKFGGATLFPTELVNKYGEAFARFRYGLNDYFWSQKGLLDISEDKNTKDDYPNHNSHPYYQNFENLGPQLVLPFEPHGDTADALTHVLLFDAVNGEIRGYSRKGGNTITGPRTGLQNLTEAAPELQWNMYAAVEPLVIHTKDGKWYYKVSIIRDAQGHATVRIIVVDAETLFPVAFNNVKDFRKYIETGKLPEGVHRAAPRKPGNEPAPTPDQVPERK
ncbi:MAG: hypothetical protein K2X93_27895 [Candidatus Obscuribacterales bacterium]|nr:hypothetical protein [Candidatus Obscuribacterales bacterium]